MSLSENFRVISRPALGSLLLSGLEAGLGLGRERTPGEAESAEVVCLTPVPVPGEAMTSVKSFSHKVTVCLGCGPVFCLYCPSSYLSFLLTNQNSSGSVMPHPPQLRRIVLPFGPWFDLRKLGEHLSG